MPTYELNTAKGPIYVEGPPAATKEQIIAIYNSSIQTATDNRVNQFENTLNQNFEGRTAAALETAKARKATIGDYLGEIPKGLVSGASSMLESGALGLAAILPEEAENVVRGGIKSVGKAVQDYVPADFNLGSTLQKSIPRSVSEATGSFLGLAGTSMINPLAGVTLAVSAGAGEASERAREDGASLEDRNLAALLGTIPGALELLPIKFLSVINKAQKQNFTDALVRIVEQTGIEGAQEAVSSIAQNLIAREVYKPEQSLTEGTAEEAALGGSVGAIIQSTLELIAPRKRGGKSSTDSSPQGELFPDEDLGQIPKGLAPEQGELFPDEDLGQTPKKSDARQGDLFRKDGSKKDDTPTGLASLRSMRDMVAESQDQVADEKAREREGLRAAGRRDEATFEQPDLFAQELERERRRLGPEELRNPEQYMDDLEAVTGKTDADKVKPVSPEQVQINRRKEREASLAMGEPFQRDLVDLMDEDKAREDSANVRKATEKAAAKERAIEADTELGLRDMQGRVDPKARRLEDQGRPEQLSFLGDLQQGITRNMLPDRLQSPKEKGGVNEQATEIKPDASRDGVQPFSKNVVNSNNNDPAGDADPKEGAGGIKPPTNGRLGSTSVVSGLPDGTKGAESATLGDIPKGIEGVAGKKAIDPKKTEAAQVARLYDEETPDAVKKVFGSSTTTNPLSEPDNKKIKDKILRGATKSDKSKKEDIPVVAYLRAFSNPFDGIEMALFDKVNATPIAKQAATYKDKAGNPVKDTDVASKADVEARRGMGGVASKKGELSSADRTIAWARANLSKEANVKISKRLQQLEDNQKNTMVFEGGPDRVVASQAAGLLNVRKNLESLVLSNYTDPMELVKAYPDVYPSKAAVEKAMFDDPSFGINVQLGLNIGAVVGLDVPIDPAVETAVNEGDLGAVLTIIADTNPVKQIRQLAEAYAKLIGSTKIVIKKDLKADDGRSVAGLFDPKTNTISLNKEAGINTHTIMHEMSHAVASADIANPESSAGQQFNKLFNDVKEYL